MRPRGPRAGRRLAKRAGGPGWRTRVRSEASRRGFSLENTLHYIRRNSNMGLGTPNGGRPAARVYTCEPCAYSATSVKVFDEQLRL